MIILLNWSKVGHVALLMMKRCGLEWRKRLFDEHLVWSGVCFWTELPYLTQLYSWLFKSKCQSLTWFVHTHTHTHTHTGRVVGGSVVSDFQLIHKHKRPLSGVDHPASPPSSLQWSSCTAVPENPSIFKSRLLQNESWASLASAATAICLNRKDMKLQMLSGYMD